MARLDSFRMKVSESERQMIVDLAELLQRTQSDSVRLVIREALRALAVTEKESGQAKGELCQSQT